MNQETPRKSNAPILKSLTAQESHRFNCDTNDIFVSDTYHVTIQAFPNNEIAIRLNPYSKGSGDITQDRLNKFDAFELANGSRVAEDKKNKEKKVSVDKNTLPGWGVLPAPKKFSLRSQKKVLRTVSAIQLKFGKENTRFLTMTLPGSTDASMMVIAKYSAYIVNRTNRFINNIIGKDSGYRVNIWELQKRGALHSHTLIGSNNKLGLDRIDKEYKSFCYSLFQDISKMSGIDVFERKEGGTWKDAPDILKCSSEAVRVDAASYMSKYMSKRISKDEFLTDGLNKIYFPSVWASYGRLATQTMYDRTLKVEGKRIEKDDSRNLILKCIELSKKYSPKKYSQPLVYLDRVGYGINLKTYVKPDYMEDYFDEICSYFELMQKRKNPVIDIKKISLEAVEKMWADELDFAIAEEDCAAKYGLRDGRLWQKRFKNNSHDLPSFPDDGDWKNFYSE